MPFREAHEIVGRTVRHGMAKGGMRETPMCFGRELTAGAMAARNNQHMKILCWAMGVLQP
jgi:argininosuccinate lyase